MLKLVSVLKDRQIDPCQIGMVVTTHGHPDHYGYLDLFKSASNYFGNFKINGPKFVPTDFSKVASLSLILTQLIQFSVISQIKVWIHQGFYILHF